jgi:hypothetical protein
MQWNIKILEFYIWTYVLVCFDHDAVLLLLSNVNIGHNKYSDIIKCIL